MTVDRDFERLLDTWLADGPIAAPDRIIDSVADRIDRQHQRPAWRLSWRDFHVTSTFKLAAGSLAILLLAVIGVAIVVRPAGSNVVGPGRGPTPSPSASPAATPTASPIALPEGTLRAGAYVIRAFAGDPLAYVVSVPDGWSGYDGWAVYGPSSYSPPDGIGIAFLHGPAVVADPCDPANAAQASAGPRSSTSPGGSSAAPDGSPVDALVSALIARRDLQVSGLTDVTLAGYSGKRLQVQLPATLACSEHYVFAEPQGLYAQGPANRWTVWILDVNGAPAVVVLMDYEATSADDLSAAQAIVESIGIQP
jgi:hypothetical protein